MVCLLEQFNAAFFFVNLPIPATQPHLVDYSSRRIPTTVPETQNVACKTRSQGPDFRVGGVSGSCNGPSVGENIMSSKGEVVELGGCWAGSVWLFPTKRTEQSSSLIRFFTSIAADLTFS